jgi:hypothetical protein
MIFRKIFPDSALLEEVKKLLRSSDYAYHDIERDFGILKKISDFYDSFPGVRYHELGKQLCLAEKRIRNRAWRKIRKQYPQIKDALRFLNNSNIPLDDGIIDSYLRINHSGHEEIDLSVNKQYSGEQSIYEPTDYNRIRAFMRLINPTTGDVIYDLGCGYGKVVFYGALVSEALFKGIELIPERVNECEKLKNILGLTNVSFISSDVNKVSLNDGNIFYLFNPFSNNTLREAAAKLRKIALKKKIKIVSYGDCTNYFNKKTVGYFAWLKKIPGLEKFYDTQAYESF